MIIDVACFKYPSVYKKDLENGIVALRCLICDEIIENIESAEDVVRHMNELRHKEQAEIKVRNSLYFFKLIGLM